MQMLVANLAMLGGVKAISEDIKANNTEYG